jgi:hypothetical protein
MLPDPRFSVLLHEQARAVGSRIITVSARPDLPASEKILFPENRLLALAACGYLGVPEDVAEAGMAKASPDSGTLAFYHINSARGSVVAIDAFSANDPQSLQLLLDAHVQRQWEDTPRMFVYNNRTDRMSRGVQFCPLLAQLAGRAHTAGIILLGDGTGPMYRRLRRMGVGAGQLRRIRSVTGTRRQSLQPESTATAEASVPNNCLSPDDRPTRTKRTKRTKRTNRLDTTEILLEGIPLADHADPVALLIGIGNIAGEGRLCVDSWNKEALHA